MCSNKEILDLLNEENISGARITGIGGMKKLLHAQYICCHKVFQYSPCKVSTVSM